MARFSCAIIQHKLAVAAFLMLFAAVDTAIAKRPNILFLLADDQRPDTIRALGNQRIHTPNLDRLVKEGTTFPYATCSYPICVISRAEIMSGRHGWTNGVNGMGGRKFDDGMTFWAETLRKAGYSTYYVGKWHTSGRPIDLGYQKTIGLFGSGGGKYWKEGQVDWKGFPITGYKGWIFQSADGRKKFPERGVGVTPDISSKFADAAIEAIEEASDQAGDKPWFLHVNFTAPHDPLFIPPGYKGRYRISDMEIPPNFLPKHPFDHGNLEGRDEQLLSWPRTEDAVLDLLRVYYSVIDDLDQQVGRIMRTLESKGQLENTIVIYSSDHGMAVGSHGLRGKQNMYEHTINVPLIIRGPGIDANRRTNAQVYLRELFATTCELASVDPPKQVARGSFAKVLQGKKDKHHQAIFGYFRDSQRMVREDGWKLIHYPKLNKWQLFHVPSDPHEKKDLSRIAKHQGRLGILKAKLMAWRRAERDPLLSVN